MIENISINNYALIDHTHIELEKGFSVITGETGAGKSILLGAIGLTLGQRADSSAIMDKTKKCIVEIEYNIAGYALKEWFDENDLDYSEQVMVRRELTAEGKSRCFINDTPVNNKLLKDFGTYMVVSIPNISLCCWDILNIRPIYWMHFVVIVNCRNFTRQTSGSVNN